MSRRDRCPRATDDPEDLIPRRLVERRGGGGLTCVRRVLITPGGRYANNRYSLSVCRREAARAVSPTPCNGARLTKTAINRCVAATSAGCPHYTIDALLTSATRTRIFVNDDRDIRPCTVVVFAALEATETVVSADAEEASSFRLSSDWRVGFQRGSKLRNRQSTETLRFAETPISSAVGCS